jgi:molybdopterin converting factor small subunit
MMNVKVRSVALVKTLLGSTEIDLSLPEQEDAHLPLRVVVNGHDLAVLEGRRTVLEDGDDVLIFVPLARGYVWRWNRRALARMRGRLAGWTTIQRSRPGMMGGPDRSASLQV